MVLKDQGEDFERESGAAELASHVDFARCGGGTTWRCRERRG